MRSVVGSIQSEIHDPTMESMAEEILREILFKLPTRDVARCRSVSRQWRRILTDPSFVHLHGHAAHVVSTAGGTPAEALAILEIRGRGIGLDMVVLNPCSAKPMCQITDLDAVYSPVNACNGFLLLAAAAPEAQCTHSHVFICNPVTGGTLKIPAPPNIMPPMSLIKYAMGFSPSSHQYKLFCLSDRQSWDDLSPGTLRSHLDVFTLGVGGGNRWRRHPHVFWYRAILNFYSPPPTLVDGKLYVVTERLEHYWMPDRMLAIDVATEAHCTYRLPVDSTMTEAGHVHPFELRGQLWVAIRVTGRGQVSFWYLPHGNMDDGVRLHGWKQQYTFYVEDDGSVQPCGVWFDASDGMMCYRLGYNLYKYNIMENKQQAAAGCFSEWDHEIPLPATPAHPEFAWKKTSEKRWNVYSGYRPSLLSPRAAFASVVHFPLHHDGEPEDDGHALLHSLRSHRQSRNKRLSTDHSYDFSAKRIRQTSNETTEFS